MASAFVSVEQTVSYLEMCLRQFLRLHERVFVCMPNLGPDSIGGMLETAVHKLNCKPILLGEDRRWKTLLRQAFDSRCSALIGHPRLVLGLTKLAQATGTPLYIRNVMLVGEPCMPWMAEGIQRGLDCRIWGCFDPLDGKIIAGFSCGKSWGVHLWEDAYHAEIWDEEDRPFSDDRIGEIVLIPKAEPHQVIRTGDRGRLLREKCRCGSTVARIMDIAHGSKLDPVLLSLQEDMLLWSSVLDFRVRRSSMGLDMEIVTFPSERLPKIPSCAKLNIRPWRPEEDIPYCMHDSWNIPVFSGENH